MGTGARGKVKKNPADNKALPTGAGTEKRPMYATPRALYPRPRCNASIIRGARTRVKRKKTRFLSRIAPVGPARDRRGRDPGCPPRVGGRAGETRLPQPRGSWPRTPQQWQVSWACRCAAACNRVMRQAIARPGALPWFGPAAPATKGKKKGTGGPLPTWKWSGCAFDLQAYGCVLLDKAAQSQMRWARPSSQQHCGYHTQYRCLYRTS